MSDFISTLLGNRDGIIIAIDGIALFMSVYVAIGYRKRCEAKLREAYREEHEWFRRWRSIREHNATLREENKMLRHRLEGRL